MDADSEPEMELDPGALLSCPEDVKKDNPFVDARAAELPFDKNPVQLGSNREESILAAFSSRFSPSSSLKLSPILAEVSTEGSASFLAILPSGANTFLFLLLFLSDFLRDESPLFSTRCPVQGFSRSSMSATEWLACSYSSFKSP
uniref:Uncharacterized protein MANES_16G068600 n=1 Tax=Rhizophora mucronata TaxID=61149 RepID=A0A2P2IN62_RHIMU